MDIKTLKQIVGEAVGEASMCWNPRPSTEVFNSDEALKISDNLCQAIRELMLECVGENWSLKGNFNGSDPDES